MTDLERMARAWWENGNPNPPLPWASVEEPTRGHVLRQMEKLRSGAFKSLCGADDLALAVLREEQAPPPPCATCGGTTKDTDVRLCEETDCPDCRPDAGK